MPVTTTNHETFTDQESADMARLVFKRFGRDLEAATAAWRRLLGNNCTVAQFEQLVVSSPPPAVPHALTRHANVTLVHEDGHEEVISNIERASRFRVEVVTGEAARIRSPLRRTRDDETTKP